MSRGALRAMFRPYVEFDFTRMAFDTRVSFSRSSTGTYFDAAGVMQTAASNVPRKAHNPATGAVRGLLVEEQRTNLLVRSQEIDNGSWLKSRATVTADATTAPDGTTSADKLVEDTTSGAHVAVNTNAIAVTAGVTYTYSIFAKAAERSFSRLTLPQAQFGGASTDSGASFNLSTGAATFISTGVTASAQSAGGGWWRCSIAMTATTSGTLSLLRVYIEISAGPSYVGDGASGLYLWGGQFEAGTFATSYIPTTTASVTRSTDVASFTIPARVVRLVTIYDDGTTNTDAVTPGASYTIPAGQKPILRIRGYFA